MDKVTQARLERFRAISFLLSTPEYQDTIGAWIDSGYESALKDVLSAKDVNMLLAAQGALSVWTDLKTRIRVAVEAGKAASEAVRKENKLKSEEP